MTWSHSREVKEELCRLAVTSDNQAASELRGIWDAAGRGARLGAVPAQLKRRAYYLAKRLGALPELRTQPTKPRPMVSLWLGRPEAIPVAPANPKAYLRGAFLARGYVAVPERSYHVEILLSRPEVVQPLLDAFRRLGLEAGSARRRQGFLVYLKNQDQVAEFLAQIGAHGARLDLASLQVVRSMRNAVNRRVNSETANLRRSAENGAIEADLLRQLRDRGGWRQLTPELVMLAELRVRHPDWSLRELGAALSPPLSKSGTAHRLRRLLKACQETDGQRSQGG